MASVECVVHLAAIAHVLGGAGLIPSSYEYINVRGTRFVAEQAARAGVRRFIFLSSVKVNGEGGSLTPYCADDPPNPTDPYARSKLAGEETLRDFCAFEGMELAIVRPPLIYGPGVRANFLRLLNLAALGLPLPLASIDNRRSLISLWNLGKFIEVCMRHPSAANRTWLVSDGEDLSTPELMRKLSRMMGKPDRLFAFSPGSLVRIGAVLGFGAEMRRLCGSLLVNTTPALECLQWRPLLTVDQGLARTVSAFNGQRR